VSNPVVVFDAIGIGWGASNTTVVLRRGTRVEKITLSRIGRVKRWVAVRANLIREWASNGVEPQHRPGRGVKHPADPAVSGESIAQGSRPKCDGHSPDRQPGESSPRVWFF